MHEEKHFTSSEIVRDVVIGISDGLTVPFALAAGLSGALNDNNIIMMAGIAEIAAGSIAMGLGGYLAGVTEYEHFKSELDREFFEIETYPERERQEIHEILKHYNISSETCHRVVNELEKDKDKYADFMMKFELGLDQPDIKRAKKSALNIGTSYIVGGLIPLSGYWFGGTPQTGFLYSSIITAICLFVFGYVKSRIMKQSPVKGAVRVLVIGALAAATAFMFAHFFSAG